MTEAWTTDRVMQIAPDAASAKAGQGLANPRKWASLGTDAALAWGECQGSGSKPYQVQVDLGEPAYKCSCPSRKFPCKHAIGLLLMLASGGGSVPQSAKPQWVEEWATSRAQRKQKQAEKAEAPPKPVDAEAQARRRAKRLDKVAAGLEALATWAEDLVRGGIASAPSRGAAFFEEPARRMEDAQAPGAARMVRELGAAASAGAGWQRPFLERLAGLHLLARAFARGDALPPETVQDVLATLGVPQQSQDEVTAAAGVRDTWQVVAREREVEGPILSQRTWLFGTTTARPALVLHFAHVSQHVDASLVPGTSFKAEVCFFPGNGVRAAVKARGETEALGPLAGFATLDDACAAYAAMLARQPWLGEVALPLREVVPRRAGERWELVDPAGMAMDASMTDDAGWAAAALSGGRPVGVVAALDGRRARPLAVVAGNEYVPLAKDPN